MHTDNLWHHWAVTFDASTGADDLPRRHGRRAGHGAADRRGRSDDHDRRVGLADFAGSIDEVRVWDVARTADEIGLRSDPLSNLNRSVIPTPVGGRRRAGLVADWSFSEGSGTTAADSVGPRPRPDARGQPAWATTVVDPMPAPTISTFTIMVSGGLELALDGLPAKLAITGSATFTASTDLTSLDLRVDGTVGLDPIGNLIGLAGHVHVDLGDSPDAYGVFLLNTAQLDKLEQLGIYVSGHAELKFNTTDQDIQDTLQVPDLTSAQIPPPTYTANVTLPKASVSLQVEAGADFKKDGTDWFQLDGTLFAYFGDPADAAGKRHPELDLYADATLSIGPKGNSLLDLHANGFVQVTDAGLAASFSLTLMASGLPQGIELKNDTLSFVLNTTGKDISYSVPSISDPTQQSGDTVNIPGTPQGASTPQPYLEIDATGGLVVGGFDLNGSFDILAAPGSCRSASTWSWTSTRAAARSWPSTRWGACGSTTPGSSPPRT